MLPKKITRSQSSYDTWDGFKRDLDSLAGTFLPVSWWLKARPKTPLPWSYFDMQVSLKEVFRIKQDSAWNR